MYRYRNDRSTRSNINAMDRTLNNLGSILYVSGRVHRNKYGVICESVIVRGQNGYARFGGMLWGYMGEGPRGLATLLEKLGMNRQESLDFAFNTVRDDNPPMGEQWRIEWHEPRQLNAA